MLSSQMHRAVGPSDGTNQQPGVPQRRTILLVTGDHDLRAVVTRVLTREGYRVVAARHSGHALLAGLKEGPIDILAAELSMDEMSGPALADRLRRLHPELRALYFANPGSSDCGGVLVHPFTRDDLVERLRLLAPASPASLR